MPARRVPNDRSTLDVHRVARSLAPVFVRVLDEEGYTPARLACDLSNGSHCAEFFELVIDHTERADDAEIVMAGWEFRPWSPLCKTVVAYYALDALESPSAWAFHAAMARYRAKTTGEDERQTILASTPKWPVNACDANGESLLLAILREGPPALMLHLLEHGADIHATTPTGDTPIHRVASRRDDRFAAATLVMLLRHGARCNARNLAGDTPLHLAAYRSSVDLFTILLNHGADPDARNEAGQTPAAFANEQMQALLARWNQRRLSNVLSGGQMQMQSRI